MYIIIDAPGFCNNRARIYSRHSTLSLAQRELRRAHYVNIPGNPRQMSACIVKRDSARGETYVFWDGIRNGEYDIFAAN